MPELEALQRVLVGTAVGDAAGLPWEGLHADVVRRHVVDAPVWPLRGAVSDDTEQSALLAISWAEADGDPDLLAQRLGSHLRSWLLGVPSGIGLGTLRALLKSFVGLGGVHSEGNGAAMRAAPLGVLCTADRLERTVEASARVTHTAPAAIEGALLVALATAGADWDQLADVPVDPQLRAHVARAARAARDGDDPDALARDMGCAGFVTGWVSHTVPMALLLGTTAPDPGAAVLAAVRQGGDTDSVAAIAGAIAAARGGPVPWEERLAPGPYDGPHLRAIASAVVRADRGPIRGLTGPVRWGPNLALFGREVAWVLRRRLLGAPAS